MISEAWKKVTLKTIASCYRHAGFIRKMNAGSTEDENVDNDDDYDDEDNVPLATFVTNEISTEMMTNIELLEFVNIDREVETWSNLSDEDIVQSMEHNDTVILVNEIMKATLIFKFLHVRKPLKRFLY